MQLKLHRDSSLSDPRVSVRTRKIMENTTSVKLVQKSGSKQTQGYIDFGFPFQLIESLTLTFRKVARGTRETEEGTTGTTEAREGTKAEGKRKQQNVL